MLASQQALACFLPQKAYRQSNAVCLVCMLLSFVMLTACMMFSRILCSTMVSRFVWGDSGLQFLTPELSFGSASNASLGCREDRFPPSPPAPV